MTFHHSASISFKNCYRRQHFPSQAQIYCSSSSVDTHAPDHLKLTKALKMNDLNQNSCCAVSRFSLLFSDAPGKRSKYFKKLLTLSCWSGIFGAHTATP
jgi:hypothetical protein